MKTTPQFQTMQKKLVERLTKMGREMLTAVPPKGQEVDAPYLKEMGKQLLLAAAEIEEIGQ